VQRRERRLLERRLGSLSAYLAGVVYFSWDLGLISLLTLDREERPEEGQASRGGEGVKISLFFCLPAWEEEEEEKRPLYHFCLPLYLSACLCSLSLLPGKASCSAFSLPPPAVKRREGG